MKGARIGGAWEGSLGFGVFFVLFPLASLAGFRLFKLEFGDGMRGMGVELRTVFM
jgi:hypothetical protein